MKRFRVYLVLSRKLGLAYIGKGPDGRLEGKHSPAFRRLLAAPDAVQYESAPFSSESDALIAEAAAIGMLKNISSRFKLLNVQKHYARRFHPRYPVPLKKGTVSKAILAGAIIVTLSPDLLASDDRVAPNSPWKPQELAERARKYWSFASARVARWSRGKRAPKLLVAVAKGNGRILGAFEIDNRRWVRNRQNRFVAVPLKNKTNANFRNLQGKLYTGNRQGGAVSYGSQVG